ncbi:MAG TPA: thiol-activated cytolysin family protein [Candidatus Krumholzibacteria bacterium]|nr:thiol-activated cytolysin family protein [Candidatus Krumholzibacteria bacterium]
MKTPKLFVHSLIPLTLLVLGACSKYDPTAPTTEKPANVNGYVAGLPAWSTFSPPQNDADVATGPSVDRDDTIEGQPYKCTTTPYSITRTPDRIVTLNPDVEILWVGSLLQGKGHLGGIGSLAELPVRQRAPLALSIDLLLGDNTKTVANPSVATVTSAIGELIQAAETAGHTAGSNIFYTREEAHSMNQAALSMGLSAAYMGASIKATLSTDFSSETRTVTAYFVQRMFNVSMVLPQTPGEVFSDDFTTDLLQQQIDRGRIGPDNLPVYISSIAYGRILMFSFTSTASVTDINATLEAMYNNGEFGGTLDTRLQQVLSQAKIQVVTVGGDAGAALALIRNNELGAYFEKDAPLTSARPISYTVRNLGDNSIASVSETTNYNLQQCLPQDLPVTGAKYTINFTKVKVLDLPYIDGWSPPPNDALDIELAWTIYVETIADGVVKVSESAHLFDAELREGDTYVLPANSATNRAIHTDGRDYIRLWGEMRDFDVTSAVDKLPFARTFRYPSNRVEAVVPAGKSSGEGYVDAKDSSGNTVRLYFTMQKTEELDD